MVAALPVRERRDISDARADRDLVDLGRARWGEDISINPWSGEHRYGEHRYTVDLDVARRPGTLRMVKAILRERGTKKD
jgi:hypothetical protein